MPRMKTILLTHLLVVFTVTSGLTQIDDQFIPLFDGKDLSRWTLGEEGGFEVIDGEIFTSTYQEGSHLFTNSSFGNYRLRLEFMLSEMGNSGVMIRCDPEDAWTTGVEVQLLSARIPQRDEHHCTGSLYGHVAVSNRPDETTGVWHKMEIRCDRSLVTISVDDKIVTQADIDTVESMKEKLVAGAIGLQVNHASREGQYAKFRNIFIRDLDLEPEYVSEGFYETGSRWRKLAHAAALSIGAGMIDPLAKMMSQDDPVARSGAKQVLFDITARASSLETSKMDREIIALTMKESAGSAGSEITRKYLEWLLGMID